MTDFVAKLDNLLYEDLTHITQDRARRHQALGLARRLFRMLESPTEHVLRLSWQEPQYIAALKTCLDLKVFDVLGEGHSPVSIDAIADATGAQPILLNRILRHLASMGAVSEIGSGTYAATELTKALRKPEVSASVECWFDIAAPTCMTLPKFLAQTRYQNPTSMENGIWQMAKQTDLTFFQYLEKEPSEMAKFANLMTGYTSDRGLWLDLFPEQRLLEDFDANSPFLIDVGGGLGHDAVRFKKRYPSVSGRLVVQDLPSVVELAKEHSGIEFMVHNFFTDQPVKGARYYFLHSILHDWPDDKAVQILRCLKPAFKRHYSRLIVNECVIPDVGADVIPTGLDLVVMSLTGTRQRTKADWDDLLKQAGFQVVATYTDTRVAYESVIEAKLVDEV